MIKTIEAMIDVNGVVYLKESIHLKSAKRVLVTILEEDPIYFPNEAALLSEKVLAEDWEKPEEEEAWSSLQPNQSS